MCSFLDELFDYPCNTDITDPRQSYLDFTPYQVLFLTYYTREKGYAAAETLNIALNTQGPYTSHLLNPLPPVSETQPMAIFVLLNVGPYAIYPRDIPWEERTKDLEANNQIYLHAALLLTDPSTMTAEYFEPYGGTAPWNGVVFEALEEYLPGYTLTVPYTQVCPYGPQSLSGDQSCANWSLLYTVLRLECPEVNVFELLGSLSREDLIYLMTQWTCWLWDYVRSHHIEEAYSQYWQIQDQLDEATDSAVYEELYTLFDPVAALRIMNG